MTVAELQQAVLLHRRDWRETSALLEVFSRGHGRLGLIARGWRRRAGWQASLQPFQLLQLHWSGRGELLNLRAVEASERQWALAGRRLYCGLYVNELLYRLLPRQSAEPRLFDHYLETLDGLAAGEPEAPVLRIFEKNLLLALGVALPLTARDAAIDTAAWYRFHPGQGLEMVSGAAPAGRGPDVISGAALKALQREHFTDRGQLAECRRLLRLALHTELEGKPLHSYDLLKKRG